MNPLPPSVGPPERPLVVVRLEDSGGAISATTEGLGRSQVVRGVQLAPSDLVTMQDGAATWSELLTELAESLPSTPPRRLNEVGQLALGEFLFRECVQDFCGPHFEWERADIVVVTDDPHLSRLPWILLAHRHQFLAAMGASVVVSGQRPGEYKDVRLPTDWRFLAIAPEPSSMERTGAEAHLESLASKLARRDPRVRLPARWRTVKTWSETKACLQQWHPHLVYFYGHGDACDGATRLAFCGEKRGRSDTVPVLDLAAECSRVGAEAPRIVYFNCCHGDRNGAVGAGFQFRDRVPVVVAHGLRVNVEAAQQQAVLFWSRVLLDGWAPHTAVAALYRGEHPRAVPRRDLRWWTPLLHRGYREWRAEPVREVDSKIHDPYWDLKLDRVGQYSTVQTEVGWMLKEGRPRIRAYAWYGLADQGVGQFGERLEVQLVEELSRSTLVPVTPVWPPAEHRASIDGPALFEEMLKRAFGVDRLDDLAERIRSLSGGVSGRRPLVYLRHEPLRDVRRPDLDFYRRYLEWFGKVVSIYIPAPARSCFLHGVGFEVRNLERFNSEALNGVRLEDLHSDTAVFRLLPPLERLTPRDIHDFLNTHRIVLAEPDRERMVRETLLRTGGVHDAILDDLRRQVAEGWASSGEGQKVASSATPSEDFL